MKFNILYDILTNRLLDITYCQKEAGYIKQLINEEMVIKQLLTELINTKTITCNDN